MIFLDAALLGVIQGLTEFLPVSSSAHLILARAFFGWDWDRYGLAFDVSCHVGTLAAVLGYFRRELIAMAAALPAALCGRGGEAGRQMWLIAAGTAPIVLVGMLFNDVIERTLRTPGIAGLALALGAVLLIAAERLGARRRAEDTLRVAEAVGLGFAQAAALVPGVSRSGATLAVGLLMGLRRDAAARFTFLLGIPAILAAAAHEAPEVMATGLTAETAALFLVGMVVSGVVGYLTVKYFIRYLVTHSLDVFAVYRLAVAATVAIRLAV